MKDITVQEKAAIYYHLATGETNRGVLFSIAYGDDRFNKLSDGSKVARPCNWWNSGKIQSFLKDCKAIQEANEKEKQNKFLESLRNTESAQGGKVPQLTDEVNFLDLDNFLQEANRQANNIKDDKERRAWLELIGKYMSFKDRNESETTDIKRFYTPIECEKCEIYNKCKSCNLPECARNLQ